MAHAVMTLQLNQQQLELLDRTIAQGVAPDRAALVRARAARVRGRAASARYEPGSRRDDRTRACSSDIRDGSPAPARPSSCSRPDPAHRADRGRPVRRLQLLQPARLQGVHALRPHAHGARLPSRPRAPSCGRRRRASARMLYILEDTVGRNDVLFPRCSAYLYESAYGFAVHTNCHDIQAEAQREYGLTPDDVHDSFNLFMCTERRRGRPCLHHAPGHASPATTSTCSR